MKFKERKKNKNNNLINIYIIGNNDNNEIRMYRNEEVHFRN